MKAVLIVTVILLGNNAKFQKEYQIESAEKCLFMKDEVVKIVKNELHLHIKNFNVKAMCK